MPASEKSKDQTVWEKLREPFPKEAVGKMPRGGIQLDYVGHAAVTDRLNLVLGPDNWNWEPMAYTELGEPKISIRGQQAIMWGRFTVKGETKPCVGTAQANKMELEKELIGDLIRNGAMRFGVAIDLWSKEELEGHEHTQEVPAPKPQTPPLGENYNGYEAHPIKIKNPDEPITDGQKKMLDIQTKQKHITTASDKKMLIRMILGEDVGAKMTKGQASELIDYLTKHQEDAVRTDLIAFMAENMGDIND